MMLSATKMMRYVRLVFIFLFMLFCGFGLWGQSLAWANGGFDIPNVKDDFNQFEQESPPEREKPIETKSNESKGFWESITQPISDGWNWLKDTVSGAWEWTKEQIAAFWDWFVGVLSKLTEVVVDALKAVWDWIVEFKEYIAFAGVLILGVVLCFVAPPLGVGVLSGMAISFLIGAGLNGWKIDETTFMEAAIGGILGLVGGGITAGVARGLASGLGQRLITGITSSRILGPLANGFSRIVGKLPQPLQQILGRGGMIGAVEGAGTSIADDMMRGRGINWGNAFLSGLLGAAMVGVGAFIIPKVTNAFPNSPFAGLFKKCVVYQVPTGNFALALSKISCFQDGSGNFDVKAFNEKIAKMPPNERVALIREVASEIAKKNNWKKDTNISRKNNRDVYYDPKSKQYYAVDTQHGTFEVVNRRGKHQQEVDFNLNQTKGEDKSGRHNLIVK